MRTNKDPVSTSRSGDRAFTIVNTTIPPGQEQEVVAREVGRYQTVQELRNRTAVLGNELVERNASV